MELTQDHCWCYVVVKRIVGLEAVFRDSTKPIAYKHCFSYSSISNKQDFFTFC